MGKTILITGGAGFIGSHLADELLARGYAVRVLDSLSPQVHQGASQPPAYLAREVEFCRGDVRDPEAVRDALRGAAAVFHLAAAVGVGQSMYELRSYVGANNLGTAVLLEELIRRPVERLVVASSMSIYGEGLCLGEHGEVAPDERSVEQLQHGRWELEEGGHPLAPLPTPERKPARPVSIYALSKFDQEQMALMIGRAYRIPTVALRFFNAYGPRQALSNPYTGVLAIFSSRYLNGRPPLIFEDGGQQRDFVSVYDVARACRLALEVPEAAGQVLNIGSGRPRTVREVAALLARVLGREQLEARVTGEYRAGDVRHCFADIGLAERVLGYAPRVTLEEGLVELAGWLEGQRADDRLDAASRELSRRGLTLGGGAEGGG